MSQGSGGNEFRTHTWCWESFALEYVTKMATTGGTSDLYTRHAESFIFMSTDGSRNGCIVK